MPDVLARELQAAGNALHMPAFIVHPHHRPAGPVGIFEFVKDRPGQGELHGNGMPFQEELDGVMVRRVAKFAFDDTDDFALVDRWVELFEIEAVGRDGFREGVGFPT